MTDTAENPETAPQEQEQAPPAKEMRVIALTGFGGLKNVKVQKRPEMTAAEGEVLIRVKACGLNFTDLIVRQGAVDTAPKTPFVLGFECAGEVEAVGENVDGFAVGDRVIGFTNYGAWGELVAIQKDTVYKMPPGMSFQDGAALPMNYLTAYVMLFEIGNLKKGQSVLIHSAGGGVGHAVAQLCKTVEDVSLFGTAAYAKHEAIKNNVNFLFDHVVDYAQEIRKVCPEGIDIVLDCLCGEDTNRGIGLLKPMGKYVLYGASSSVTGETKSFLSFAKSWWQVDKINPVKLYDENKTISGFRLRHLVFGQGRHEYIRGIMDKLFQLYSEGKIRPTIDSAWPFEDASEAMQKLHDRKNIGKLVLDPSLEPKIKENDSSPVEDMLSKVKPSNPLNSTPLNSIKSFLGQNQSSPSQNPPATDSSKPAPAAEESKEAEAQ